MFDETVFKWMKGGNAPSIPTFVCQNPKLLCQIKICSVKPETVRAMRELQRQAFITKQRLVSETHTTFKQPFFSCVPDILAAAVVVFSAQPLGFAAVLRSFADKTGHRSLRVRSP